MSGKGLPVENCAIKMNFCHQILDMMKMMLTITSAWVLSAQVMIRANSSKIN